MIIQRVYFKNLLSIILLFAIFYFLNVCILHATGPSTARIKIIPIACNEEGVILFKTSYYINHMGAGFSVAEYGWLIVSVYEWKEIPNRKIMQNDFKGYEKAETEFNQPLNWDNPPERIRDTIKAYKFNATHKVNPEEGKDKITWNLKGLHFKNKRIQEKVNQKSLKNLSSCVFYGTEVKSSFYKSKVVIFKNLLNPNFEDEETNISLEGGYFHIPNFYSVTEDSGIDSWEIDAVCIVRVDVE